MKSHIKSHWTPLIFCRVLLSGTCSSGEPSATEPSRATDSAKSFRERRTHQLFGKQIARKLLQNGNRKSKHAPETGKSGKSRRAGVEQKGKCGGRATRVDQKVFPGFYLGCSSKITANQRLFTADKRSEKLDLDGGKHRDTH